MQPIKALGPMGEEIVIVAISPYKYSLSPTGTRKENGFLVAAYNRSGCTLVFDWMDCSIEPVEDTPAPKWGAQLPRDPF